MTNLGDVQTPTGPNLTQSTAKDIPPNNLITPASVTINPNKKSKFGLFVTIGIVLITLIYGVVFYIYIQNKKIKTGNSALNNSLKNNATITPSPTFIVENVKVIDGNISYQEGNSGTKVLVNKNDYPGSGITGFLKLSISPDKANICFESWSPAPKPALYLSKIDGSNVVEVSSNRKNCIWSPDSKNILYINTISGNSASDIYIYNLEKKEEKNLTFTSSDSNGKKRFDIVGLSADGNRLICTFEYLDVKKDGGQCEINLSSLEMSYL